MLHGFFSNRNVTSVKKGDDIGLLTRLFFSAKLPL